MKRELEDIKAVNRRIIATLVRLEGKVDDMSDRMITHEQLLVQMGGSLGRLAVAVDDLRERVILQASILTAHDERLKKLENQ